MDRVEVISAIISNMITKTHGLSEEQRIAGLTKRGFQNVMSETMDIINGLNRELKERDAQIRGLISAAQYQRDAKPIKDYENHWHCGKCMEKLPMKKEPKYCHKCGTKIRFLED